MNRFKLPPAGLFVAPRAAPAVAVEVRRIRFEGHTVFTEDELLAIVPESEDGYMTQKDLDQLKLGALAQGFNAIDLSMAALNKNGVKLEPEVEYQWTLGCLDRLDKSSVFVRMTLVDNPDLTARLKAEPTDPATLSALSESGNWYELFDIVALSSRLNPADETTAGIRDRLLGQLGLDAAVKP